MEIKRTTKWRKETRESSKGGTYEVSVAVFEITAFGETRELIGSMLAGWDDESKVFIEGGAFGQKRGPAGTKVWYFGIMVGCDKKTGEWNLYGTGSSYGHRGAGIVGWWDKVPTAAKSKHY